MPTVIVDDVLPRVPPVKCVACENEIVDGTWEQTGARKVRQLNLIPNEADGTLCAPCFNTLLTLIKSLRRTAQHDSVTYVPPPPAYTASITSTGSGSYAYPPSPQR